MSYAACRGIMPFVADSDKPGAGVVYYEAHLLGAARGIDGYRDGAVAETREISI